jgi:hypothetical protein
MKPLSAALSYDVNIFTLRSYLPYGRELWKFPLPAKNGRDNNIKV